MLVYVTSAGVSLVSQSLTLNGADNVWVIVFKWLQISSSWRLVHFWDELVCCFYLLATVLLWEILMDIHSKVWRETMFIFNSQSVIYDKFCTVSQVITHMYVTVFRLHLYTMEEWQIYFSTIDYSIVVYRLFRINITFITDCRVSCNLHTINSKYNQVTSTICK